MAGPSEKLAASLDVLSGLQDTGQRVFQSRDLSRVHRERLVRNGFLNRIVNGWLYSTRPETKPGDTTPWYASFWEFCGRYGSQRFGDEWHLSPELSLLLYAGDTSIPRQVVIYTPRGTNNTIELPFGTSLYDLKSSAMPNVGDQAGREGLQLFTPAAALVRVPEAFFIRHPVPAQVVLTLVPDSSDVLRPLLEGGHSAVAGRLSGAFRRIGRGAVADEILETMSRAGYDVREADPFELSQRMNSSARSDVPPAVLRVQGLWATMREAAVDAFPKAPGVPDEPEVYLNRVEEIYQSDAYHSLSIEGYEVTPELVDRVRTGEWDPARHGADQQARDALAARGYWQAFQSVKKSTRLALTGANPGEVVRQAHRIWYRELFQPFVAAGMAKASDLSGYRNRPVYLKGSRHVPPRAAAVREAMPAFFDLLEGESHPAARAVMGHWLIGYIHPFPDGNGRIARFLMNVMLASGGYPWTVIRVEDRSEYLDALEAASVGSDIRPFARFLGERVAGRV